MRRIVDYCIVEGADKKAMVEDAQQKLTEGWEPLGPAMPRDYTEFEFQMGERTEFTYSTLVQTWVWRRSRRRLERVTHDMGYFEDAPNDR